MSGSKPLAYPRLDLLGLRFGRLTVTAYAGRLAPGRSTPFWTCVCDCGRSITTRGPRLKSGTTKSCGRHPSKHRTTHGLSHTPEYQAWRNMLDRCCNQKSYYYAYYGGRGITVCERWRTSFEAFYEDMGSRPSPVHSLERKENNAGYEPVNCVWSTREVQSQNRRTARLLTHGGQTRTAAEWARLIGVSTSTIHNRLAAGWSDTAALGFEPARARVIGSTPRHYVRVVVLVSPDLLRHIQRSGGEVLDVWDAGSTALAPSRSGRKVAS